MNAIARVASEIHRRAGKERRLLAIILGALILTAGISLSGGARALALHKRRFQKLAAGSVVPPRCAAAVGGAVRFLEMGKRARVAGAPVKMEAVSSRVRRTRSQATGAVPAAQAVYADI